MGRLLPGIIAASGLLIYLLWPEPINFYRKALIKNEPPQVILVLGGDIDREHVGVKLATELNLPLIVSGGSNPEHARWLVQQAGISPQQVKLDYRAKDTLSNFTSLVDELYAEGITHTLLITSKDHLPRAMAVGQVIAGSRGIGLTGIPVECSPNCQNESLQKHIFDLIRAITWVAIGEDLKVLSQTRFGVNIQNSFKKIFQAQSEVLDPREN